MSELESRSNTPSERAAGEAQIFGTRSAEQGGFPVAVWAVAALITLAVAGVLVFAGRKKATVPPNTLQSADGYAASLPLSQLAMSESSSLSAVKLTYLDGHVRDTGDRTIGSVTVQVVFGNDEGLPPQVETMPLTLIRMREPYIDTEPVGAEPLKPGVDREFRLIFEKVPENWNTQMPEVRVIHTDAK